nr:hypothetical protein [Tanacetum cinerariifolium]
MSKSVSRDVILQSSEFNVEHYATLVVYPAPFHKYPEPFLCLVGLSRNYTLDENNYPQFLRDNDEEMDLLSFIRTVDPTKARIGERQRDEDEPKLLETIVGSVFPLLPVAPDLSSGELEASVDKLLDDGGSGEQVKQGRSARGGQGAGIQPVSRTEEVVAEDVVPLQPMCGTSVGGKSQSAVQQLLSGAVLNVEIRGGSIPTFLFASQRFVISSDSSHHSGANIAEADVDSFARPSALVITTAFDVTSTADPAAVTKEKIVEPSLFSTGSASGDGTGPATGGFADLSGSDFLIGASQFEVVEKYLQYEVQTLMDRNASLEKEKGELDNDNLADQVHKLETSSAGLQEKVMAYENCMSQLEELQDDRIKEMNDKFEKLDTDLVEMTLHLEERFYPHLVTTISGSTIIKAVEKGMQDGLSARITHGAEELKSNKDASIDTIMNLLRLEDSLAEKLGLTESVWRIKENIAKHRSALHDVFVPLSKPFSVTALTGTDGTLNVIPATVDTTMAMSVTSVSASLIPPISIDDYEIAHARVEKV